MIRVQVDGGRWQTLGAERDRPLAPAGIAPTWDAWGPAALNFNIGRDPALQQPDLAAFTPIEYVPYGRSSEPAWGGYIIDTPAAADGLSVVARGWQYALDDRPYTDTYVHANLADWKDARSVQEMKLYDGTSGFTAAGTVSTDAGGITISVPQGTVLKANGCVGITLDLGPLSRGAKTVSVDTTITAGWSVASQFYIRGSDTPGPVMLGGAYEDGTAGAALAPNVGNQTFTTTYGTPRRYVTFFRYFSPGGTTTVEELLRINAIRVFTSDTYRAGAASALLASHIQANALGKVPALEQDTSLIATTLTTIPAYGGLNEARTARQDIDQANTYHRYITRVRADRRLETRQRFAYATLEANTRRPGIEWQDASTNSGEDVYNEVVLKGKAGSGTDLAVTRTSAGIGVRNVLDRRNRIRTKTLEVQAPTDPGIMAAIGDVWLQRYARTPLKGTLTISGHDALREIGGTRGPVRAAYAGSRTGEGVLLSNLIDPDSGDRGRFAITAGCTYNEETDVATMAIDNTRDDLEALLARMGVVSG